MRFMSQFNTDYLPEKELNSGESDVETAGYRSTAQQVRDFLDAGAKLESAREASYSYHYDENGKESEPYNFTLEHDFDPADATQAILAQRDKLVSSLDGLAREKSKKLKAKSYRSKLHPQDVDEVDGIAPVQDGQDAGG